jgi:flagellin
MNIGNINSMAMSVGANMGYNSQLGENALSRLSSGLRLNKAADDASSMQIADSLRSDANTTNQEIKNYNDEIGILNTADKAIDEQVKMLDLIKVKSVQMANDSQNEETRKAIKADISKLLKSIDNIANTTQYNGKALISGNFTSRHGLEIGDTDTSKTGHTNIQHSRAISTAGETQLTFRDGIDTVTLESVEIGTAAGTGVGVLAETINKNSDKLGLKADWTVKSVGQKIEGGDLEDFKINGVMIGTVEDIKANDKDGKLVNAINQQTDKHGVMASTSEMGQLVLQSVDGRGIKIESKADSEGGMGAHGVYMLENYGSISLTKTNASSSMDVEATGVLTNGFASHDQVFTLQDFHKGFSTTDIGYGDGFDYGNSSDEVGLNTFKNSNPFANVDGQGFTVAVLDTGIDADHEAFGGDSNGDGLADRVLAQVNFTDDGLGDSNGHGTHVAGIIASAGDSNGNHQGVASKANVIDVKVLGDDGSSDSTATGGSVSDGLQWVIDNAEKYNITAINMSLGATEYNDEYKNASYHDKLQTLKDMGIINLAAAGNTYVSSPPTTGISVPGADRATIGVGALVTDDSESLASFSQRSGVTSEIFAPGHPIMSAKTGGGWIAESGTSMATPFIAGAAVLSQQLAESEMGRRLHQDEFLSLLRASAVDVYDDAIEDGVTGTEAWYKRIDMDALGNAIVNYAQEMRGADGAYEGQIMMSVAESAIEQLDKVRGDIGSQTNNLVSKINNASVKEVQLKASESQLRDADFAQESADFQKQNILKQSGSFAMSQVLSQYDKIGQLLR